ncbi:undecaprenyl-phosphate glucose phosphotransferase [Iodobacter arcticus]|uniref:Undecaprenyl-phosphate glucose phosphotransferase n=1 Tax=Iodobacter arcticus TaxID=590593 RepID=A0ABW2QYH4_9NEIS
MDRNSLETSIVATPSLLADRFREFSNAAPFISFFKLFIDPILVVVTLYLLAIPFHVAMDGYEFILATLAFLLTAILLDGMFLFMPGYSRSWLGVGRFITEWLGVVIALVLIGRISGFIDYYYPPFIITWFIVAPIVLISVHVAIRVYVLRVDSGENAERSKVVVVGINQPSQLLVKNIHEEPFLKMDFMGYFDDRSISRLPKSASEHLKGSLDSLPKYIKEHGIKKIYISLPMSSQPRVLELIDELKDSTASIYFIPDLFVFDLINARFDNVAGMPIVAICESPFMGLNGVIKRISDISLSLLILSMIWPVLVAIALAVKFTSAGPVFFKQRRYGENGDSVLVYKFRSMTVMEDGEKVVQATKNDQRLTSIGSFLRKTSLDELPQFINVLQGKMSIVGPRPHANAHNEQYRKLIKGYMIRHKVKPGITGWAQVNGFRGETDTLDKMQNRIKYDLDYLRNWSVWLDLKIIVLTVAVIFRDRNAY